MTRLAGEFQTDLPLPDALAACAEALHSLGWHLETVEGSRIVSYADGEPPGHASKIEVELTDAGRATDFRIIGTDNDASPLDQDELIAVLDRARDAIQQYVEGAEDTSQQGTPAGWFPDPDGGEGERYWDGSQWTDRTRRRQGVEAARASRRQPARAPTKKEGTWWQEHRLGLALGVIAFFVGVALGTSGGSTETTTVRRTETTQGPVRTQTQIKTQTQTVTSSTQAPGSAAGSSAAPPSASSGTGCDPSYAPACLDPNSSDYDCEGGGGDGPDYVSGPISIVGDDHYGLDSSDQDGVGCE
jgi:hypothetical protein